MINVAIVWLALAAVLVGWGLAVVALLRRAAGTSGASGASGGALTGFQTLWLGYAGLLAALQLASLVLPVNTGLLVASAPVAIAGYVARRRFVARRLRALSRRPRELAVVVPGANACVDADRIDAAVMMHHGTLDESCPYRWAVATREALERADVDLTFHAYEGEHHTFYPQWEQSMRRTVDFLRANA